MSPVTIKYRGEIAIVTVDNPPVNALSQAVREGLINTVVQVNTESEIKAIILICSGRTFIAGADIREFNRPPKPPHLPDVVAAIEASTKLFITAIHGSALGGGLEVALGCHYRVARADASVGFPEVNLGLIPGSTGTQRLPRVAGVQVALDMMVSGKPVRATKAKNSGVIDEVVEEGDLLNAAMVYARKLIDEGAPLRRVRDLTVDPVGPEFFDDFRKTIAKKTRGLIAPEQIIRCVEASLSIPFDEAVAQERKSFLACRESEQSAALRHVFFAERNVAKVPELKKGIQGRKIETLAVIGAGTMGAGIAYSGLAAGMKVVLLDNDAAGLERGQKTIEGLFEGGVARGRVSEQGVADGLARLKMTRSYPDIADVDLVIEAVFENMAIKKEVFTRLDEVIQPSAILATNTSTLDINEIASATRRPNDVIGLHFFSPAHVMRLIEIVRGAETSQDVIATSLSFAKRLRKMGVVVGNCFGFVGNRMLYSYGRESQLLLLEGAPPEYIDKVLTDFGMAMGPHAVGDLAGLDVGYKVRRERSDLPDDPCFYRIADVLSEMGRFGQKTGKGMYLYEGGSRVPIPDPEIQALIQGEAEALGVEQRTISEAEIVERCIYGLIVEGARIIEEGIVYRSSDIDLVWINGYGFPRFRGGPMFYADRIGVDKVYATVCNFCERFSSMYWDPPKLLQELAEQDGRFSEL